MITALKTADNESSPDNRSYGDLLHSATIAIVGQLPLERLWHAIPPFPTMNEIWISLLEKYGF